MKNNTNILKPAMGLLNVQKLEKKFRLTRYTPSEDIGFFVKHFWIVRWDLTEQEPYAQHVVPNPCVNMVIEHNKSGIFAPAKNKFSYLIKDKGCVFGVKFKPGGFYPFYKKPVSKLTNSPLKIRDLFNAEDRKFEKTILTQGEDGTMVEFAENLIRQRLPDKDENITFINQVIDHIYDDREMTKVDSLCQFLDINIRKLQRLFHQYVGLSPKWVIKLYRLQNAAETMENAQHQDWLQLSLDLGYYDQSHFIKDFTAIIGQTPNEYASGI